MIVAVSTMHAASIGARHAAAAIKGARARGIGLRIRESRAVAAAAAVDEAGDAGAARTFAEAERMPVPKNFRVKIETAKCVLAHPFSPTHFLSLCCSLQTSCVHEQRVRKSCCYKRKSESVGDGMQHVSLPSTFKILHTASMNGCATDAVVRATGTVRALPGTSNLV